MSAVEGEGEEKVLVVAEAELIEGRPAAFEDANSALLLMENEVAEDCAELKDE